MRAPRRSFRIATSLVAVCTLLTVSVTVPDDGPVSAASAIQPSLLAASRQQAALAASGDLNFTQTVMNVLQDEQTSAGMPSYLPSNTMPRTDVGPAVAMLAEDVISPDAANDTLAVRDINYLIEQYAHADGSINASSSTTVSIDTMFFATQIGMACVMACSRIPETAKNLWIYTVTNAANFIINSGDLTWYSNGNLLLGDTLLMALAYKLTRARRYANFYNDVLEFAMDPNQTRWPGYGFIVVDAGTASDGSDGRGYFTEAGANGIGYDGDYTMLQDEQLSKIYLITGDPRVLRVLNMVDNQLLSKTNTNTWMLNSSGGTRHDYSSEQFDAPGLVLLALRNLRPDRLSLVPSFIASVTKEFQTVTKQQTPLGDRYMYVFGMIASTIALASSAQYRIPTNSKISATSSIVRIAAFPRDVIGYNGNIWRSDVSVATGGNYSVVWNPIAGTKNVKLLDSARIGTFAYSIPVTPGAHTVTLYFAEQQCTARGARVFDVLANGNLKLRDVDIYAEAGAEHAMQRRFSINTGSTLNLTFAKVAGNPSISAIQIS